MKLLMVERRRALRRRAVRVLIGLALLGCAFAGVVAFATSSDISEAQHVVEAARFVDPAISGDDGAYPAAMVTWYSAGIGEGFLLGAAFFLVMGGLVGGATVAGAEWRAGTVATVLTWDPRRWRVHIARAAACGILAVTIAFVLQAILLAAFAPAVIVNGTTWGIDGRWWIDLVSAMSRIALLTGTAAMIGVALATLGRNTAFAVVAAFGWMAIGENLVRNLRPGLRDFLVAENIGTVMTWGQLDDVDFGRGPAVALLTIVLYTVALVAIAGAVFGRRDIAGSS